MRESNHFLFGAASLSSARIHCPSQDFHAGEKALPLMRIRQKHTQVVCFAIGRLVLHADKSAFLVVGAPPGEGGLGAEFQHLEQIRHLEANRFCTRGWAQAEDAQGLIDCIRRWLWATRAIMVQPLAWHALHDSLSELFHHILQAFFLFLLVLC